MAKAKAAAPNSGALHRMVDSERTKLENQMLKMQEELQEVASERTKLENQMLKAQDKLRGLDRQQESEKFAAAVGPVNDLRRQIAEVSQRQIELARMVSTMKGGTNYMTPVG